MACSTDIYTAHPTKISSSTGDAPNPYKYTSGRWLRRDKLEHDARILTFDFNALRTKVLELSPGAASITNYEKKEGGYNRVFIFTCDNSRRVVARIPTSVAGPARLTTNSEVATIRYIQSNTNVPSPKILDWSDDPSNAIGCEYIITEHATGVQLHQKWPMMSGEQQIACIEAITRNIQQIAAIDFTAYGSIYFADSSLNPASTLPLGQGFCIGPHCGARYWDCNVGEGRFYNLTKPNRGPWPTLGAYCDGLIDAGLSRLPAEDDTFSSKPAFHGRVATHARLLDVGGKVIRKLSQDPRIEKAGAATLGHADLHKRNIFVSDKDPTIITDFIDWQSSSIEPAFEYLDETPDFTAALPNTSPEDQRALVQADLCKQAFDACLQCLAPKLYTARTLDHDLLRPFRYCHRTWKDGAVAFRHELIEVSRRWKELGLSGSCPYQTPTLAELRIHQKDYQSFVVAQELKQRLIVLLDSAADGWVPASSWEAARKAQKEVFHEITENIRNTWSTDGDSMSEEDLKRMWPFDII